MQGIAYLTKHDTICFGGMITMDKDKKLYKYNYISFNEYKKASIDKKLPYYKNPSMAYIKPFKIFGNLYYIGDKMVCSHLIDTGDGLIVFDSGYQHTIHLLVQSIWESGFNPSQIKYLIHTHGHFDHFGGCNEFRSLYNCKTIMSRVDVDMLKDNPAGALMDINPNPYAQLPIIDEVFEDGDVISLGNTKIKCVLIPGHTPGNTAFFFNIFDDKNQKYNVGYIGGTGFMTLHKTFLDEYDFPYTLRDDYIVSINKIKKEHVDIVLAGHPLQNKLLEKRKAMTEQIGSNPFINPKEWGEVLNRLLLNFKTFIASDSK